MPQMDRNRLCIEIASVSDDGANTFQRCSDKNKSEISLLSMSEQECIDDDL